MYHQNIKFKMLSTLGLHKGINLSTIWSFNQRPEAYDIVCGLARVFKDYFNR